MNREELIENLKNPIWRICNLYSIKVKYDNGETEVVPFKPRPAQMELLRAIYILGWKRIVVPKSRQIGFSTLLGIIKADRLLFSYRFDGKIIERSEQLAADKASIINTAMESVPDSLMSKFEVNDINSQITISKEYKDKLGKSKIDLRKIIYSQKARGGTFNMLWVSELGFIAANDKVRAKEIEDGAFPACKNGLIVVESTWIGGQEGLLWDITNMALTEPDEYKNEYSWRVMFFPWWGSDDDSREGDIRMIPQACMEYLDKVQDRILAEGGEKVITDGQKIFYYQDAWSKGDSRYKEFPSFMDEMWQVDETGLIYYNYLQNMKVEKRIGSFPYNPAYPVSVFYDIGNYVNTHCIYMQFYDNKIYIIDHDADLDIPFDKRIEHMKSKGYNYRMIYLPHDGNHEKIDGSVLSKFQQHFPNRVCYTKKMKQKVEAKESKQDYIERAVQLMQMNLHINIERCAKCISYLGQYQYKKNKDGELLEETVKNSADHTADALKTYLQAEKNGMVEKDVPWLREIQEKSVAPRKIKYGCS